MKKRTRIAITIMAAVLAAVLLCVGLTACAPPSDDGNPPESQFNVTVVTSNATTTDESLVEMLERIRPTVVDVDAYLPNGTSAGSGVIIGGASADGEAVGENGSYDSYLIVTNHHVIEGATSFTVDVLTIAEDGTESTTAYPATLIGSAPKRDIAVLSIDPPDGVELSVATFIADSDTVKVGTEVVAIGNPLGILGGTVTHGIVSTTKREVSVEGIGTMTLMQTDATINGGNSGGGLFDMNGNLIGIINSGYDTYNGQSVEGLNFDIPGNDALFAATSLIDTYDGTGDTVQYGYIEGDAVTDITYSASAVYESEDRMSRGIYLLAQATSENSPFYEAWLGTNEYGNPVSTVKAVTSVTVNGTKTDITLGDGESSYVLSDLASEAFGSIRAGDTVTVEYRDVMQGNMGFWGSYTYLGQDTKTVTYTAEQYVYNLGD